MAKPRGRQVHETHACADFVGPGWLFGVEILAEPRRGHNGVEERHRKLWQCRSVKAAPPGGGAKEVGRHRGDGRALEEGYVRPRKEDADEAHGKEHEAHWESRLAVGVNGKARGHAADDVAVQVPFARPPGPGLEDITDTNAKGLDAEPELQTAHYRERYDALHDINQPQGTEEEEHDAQLDACGHKLRIGEALCETDGHHGVHRLNWHRDIEEETGPDGPHAREEDHAGDRDGWPQGISTQCDHIWEESPKVTERTCHLTRPQHATPVEYGANSPAGEATLTVSSMAVCLFMQQIFILHFRHRPRWS